MLPLAAEGYHTSCCSWFGGRTGSLVSLGTGDGKVAGMCLVGP